MIIRCKLCGQLIPVVQSGIGQLSIEEHYDQSSNLCGGSDNVLKHMRLARVAYDDAESSGTSQTVPNVKHGLTFIFKDYELPPELKALKLRMDEMAEHAAIEARLRQAAQMLKDEAEAILTRLETAKRKT